MVPKYGDKLQYENPEDSSRPLTKEETIFVQQVIRKFLFYGRAVDETIMKELIDIAS